MKLQVALARQNKRGRARQVLAPLEIHYLPHSCVVLFTRSHEKGITLVLFNDYQEDDKTKI